LALLVTFVAAINAIGLTVAADLLNRIVLYIPNIIAAIFILILGMFVATLLSNIVRTAANNAGVAQSKLLGKVVEIAVAVFAIAITLEQLGIGAKVIELFITVILASIGLGLALAFGLGCKDIAAKFLNELIDNIKSKK
jgi:putative Mn2+ efflux pump MntP